MDARPLGSRPVPGARAPFSPKLIAPSSTRWLMFAGCLPWLVMCQPNPPASAPRIDGSNSNIDAGTSSPEPSDGGGDRDAETGTFDARPPHSAKDASALDADGPRADGGPDGGPINDGGPPDALATCPSGPAPAWIEVYPGGASLAARCDRNMVVVETVGAHMLKLAYRAWGSEAPRSWVVPDGHPAPPPTRIGRDGDAAIFCTPELVVRIEPERCAIEVTDQAGHTLLKDDGNGFERASVTVDEREKPIARLTRAAPADEHYYGLGERTGSLDRRGRRYIFQNTDAYDHAYGGFPPDADPLYLGVPFFVGLREGVAYGLFTDTPSFMRLDLAETDATRYTIEAEARSLEQYLILGPRVHDVLKRYTQLTGRMPIPPRWSLGYHQSRWGYSPAERVVELAQTFRRKSLPAEALWLDIQHMDGFRNFTFDPSTFPDPQGLAETLHQLGFRLVTIVDPGIKIDPEWRVYADGARDGHFILDDLGEPCAGLGWAGPSAFVDFTSGSARAFWAQEIARFASIGIDGIWLDLNEPTTLPESGRGNSLPEHLPVRADGHPEGVRTGEVRNIYGLLEAAATYAGLKALRPSERPFILSRSGYAGIQQYAAVWTGDAPSTWWSLEQSLPMMLGLGLSGIPFIGSDVGGYSGHASAALFARWMSLGALSPFFRGHVTTNVNDQEPWAFGAEVETLSREVMRTRYQRMPYLYSVFREASLTGIPILRPMLLEFQDDAIATHIDDQAMLGPSLLVAPILREDATDRDVYLPAGRWLDATSLAAFDGPTTIRVHAPLSAGSPTFLRAGALVPRWTDANSTTPPPETTLELDVFASPAPRLQMGGRTKAAEAAAGLASSPSSSLATSSFFDLYEDDGLSFDHLEQDAFRAVRYTLEPQVRGARLTASRLGGQLATPKRRLLIRWLRIDNAPEMVSLNHVPLHPSDLAPGLDEGPSWRYDAQRRILTVALPDVDTFELTLSYDPDLTVLRPTILVPVEVQVPESTPEGAIIHIATSSQGWRANPLSPAEQGKATGFVEAELGAWFEYKYTLGDWTTVEKTLDCTERSNREGLAAAQTVLKDEVARWRGDCP
ncbi:MAG: hypothetical protein IPK13_21345 [Deltaproteobacteria bacterium]|nr:hypothetical protein [Deltaproteobacteria bacterium]